MVRPLPESSPIPAITRLRRLAALDIQAVAALQRAADGPRRFRGQHDLLGEGEPITEPLLILNGWAARTRILPDGRRQILSFLLPGDLIGMCPQDRPIAASTVTAITEVEACVAPSPDVSATLVPAYAMSVALEDAYLLAQITRLGRMNAMERIGDFVLELLERLNMAGLATGGTCIVPLTQEHIADTLGLTSVHVNRTLQTLRRDGVLTWKGRELTVHDRTILARTVGRNEVRVTR